MNTIRRNTMRRNAGGQTKPLCIRRLFAVLCSIAFIIASGCGGGSGAAPTSTVTLPGIEEMLSDKVLGDPNAPVTIIDYSALTCPHCADFHLNTLPLVKAKYIDTGKARLVYRDFPFNQAGIIASMLARCSGNTRYFDALELIYANQASWAAAADPEVALANILGMPREQADACLADQALSDGIQAMEQDGQQRYGVTGTPTFIINGQKIVGDQPFAVFDEVLGALAP